MKLLGKTILVTGASSGIGLELSRLLAKEKVKLAILARRKHLLTELAEELKDSGSLVLPLKCDVANRDEVRNVCREIRARLGPVDIAILNSGASHRAGVENYDINAAREVFDVNVFGILNFVGELLPDLLERRTGAIVGVSSVSDSRGFPRSGFYSASKSAASFLLESLRVELKKHGVKVITVRPGFVKTSMTDKNKYPMPFIMTAERAARIILRGIKKDKRVIQFPWPTVLGGRLVKVLPNLLFEKVADKIRK